MESYYSSDEEIAWGPLTLREIKKDLSRAKKPHQIKYRRSDMHSYTKPEIYEFVNSKNGDPDSNIDVKSLNLHESEDATKNSNDDEIIVLSDSDSEDYDPVIENKNSISPKLNIKPEKKSICTVDEDFVSNEPSQSLHESYKYSDISSEESALENEIQKYNDPVNENQNYYLITSNTNEELSAENLKINELKESETGLGAIFSNDAANDYSKRLSDIYEYSDNGDENKTSDKILESENICIKDEQSNSSLNDNFNDTLAEIEMAFKMKNELSLGSSSLSEHAYSDIPDKYSFNNLEIREDKMPKEQLDHKEKCVENVGKKIGKTKHNPYINIISPVGAYIKNHNSPKEFKLPLKPISLKGTPLKSSNLHNQYKDIISPVAHYIKNSPKVPLFKAVQPVCMKHIPSFECTSPNIKPNHNKITDDCLPPVVYKPGKQKVIKADNKDILPNSMRSLIPQRAVVVRHEQRICHEKSEIEQKLLDADLTQITMNESLLDVSKQNVSIVSSKFAHIK